VIVVSESDWLNARIFTLFHEYAHLLLREPGICLPYDAITVGCRHRAFQISLGRSANVTDENFKEIADRYRVSRYVVLIRLISVGGISDEMFTKTYRRWQSQVDLRQSRPKKPASGGASAVDKCIRQRGKPFVALVMEAAQRGLITTSDAMAYLDVRLKDLGQLDSQR
jgi:Zn-dependent peptidase ImmA (M78 family)